jgi:Curli production assembly/transport component CsgG
MSKNLSRIAAAALFPVLVLAGCAQVSSENGLAAAQPSAEPVPQLTRFSGALTCLRRQLAKVPGQSQFITAGNIPDATTKITHGGIRDMVSAAVFSATNGTSRYIPVEAATVSGVAGVSLGTIASQLGLVFGPSTDPRSGPPLPVNAVLIRKSMQITGALSQADRAVEQSDLRGGLGIGDQSVGASATSEYGAVTLDLRLVDVQTGVILQTASNVLVVRNSGRAANVALKIASLGVSFDASFDRREGPHQAVRTLVDLSVLELLGRQARVPFSKCLPANGASVVSRSIGQRIASGAAR